MVLTLFFCAFPEFRRLPIQMSARRADVVKCPSMEGEQIGSYRVLHKLGEGGMGVVYKAVNDSIDRYAAIKVLHPQFSQTPRWPAVS